MLGKLEDKHLLKRHRSKSDQRAVRLYITEEGRVLLSKAPSPEGRLSSALSKLSPQQIAALDNAIKPLVDALYYNDEKADLTPIQSNLPHSQI